jgi:polyadenylate-binding protein
MSDPIYVRGFPSSLSEVELKSQFRQFGRIKAAYIVSKPEDKGKLYAIVKFFKDSSNAKAIEALHEKTVDNISWYVVKCEQKSKRDRENKKILRETKDKNKGKGLYIRNFPSSWTENEVKERFQQYGSLTSVKITEKVIFANFETEEQAKAAVQGAKGLQIDGTKLYVTICIDNKHNVMRKIIHTTHKKQQKKAALNKPEEKVDEPQEISASVHPKMPLDEEIKEQESN